MLSFICWIKEINLDSLLDQGFKLAPNQKYLKAMGTEAQTVFFTFFSRLDNSIDFIHKWWMINIIFLLPLC